MKKCIWNNLKSSSFFIIIIFLNYILYNIIDTKLINDGILTGLWRILWEILKSAITLTLFYLFGRYCLSDTYGKKTNNYSSLLPIVFFGCLFICFFIINFIWLGEIDFIDTIMEAIWISMSVLTYLIPFRSFLAWFIMYIIYFALNSILMILGLHEKIKR